MCGARFQKTNDGNLVVDVFLEHGTYDRFKAFQTAGRLDESHALVQVLQRGMTDYWLQEFKQLKESYSPLEKMFTEFKRDNETLKAIERENEELENILRDTSKKSREQKHEDR